MPYPQTPVTTPLTTLLKSIWKDPQRQTNIAPFAELSRPAEAQRRLINCVVSSIIV